MPNDSPDLIRHVEAESVANDPKFKALMVKAFSSSGSYAPAVYADTARYVDSIITARVAAATQFKGEAELIAWLDSLHECDANGAVHNKKWAAAQHAIEGIRATAAITPPPANLDQLALDTATAIIPMFWESITGMQLKAKIQCAVLEAIHVAKPALFSQAAPAKAEVPKDGAVIVEAAQVLESAAAHNRSKGRTVLAHSQQDRADRLREFAHACGYSFTPAKEPT